MVLAYEKTDYTWTNAKKDDLLSFSILASHKYMNEQVPFDMHR